MSRSGWAGSTLWNVNRKTWQKFRALAQDIKTAGFQYALLLGMGGSSLCPEVLAETFGQQEGFRASPLSIPPIQRRCAPPSKVST